MTPPNTPFKVGELRVMTEGGKYYLCRATPPLHEGFTYVQWEKIREVPSQHAPAIDIPREGLQLRLF
jgi:hypothetical protein